MAKSLSMSKLFEWHYHPLSCAWGIKEYPGLFVERFQLHHQGRVDFPWNAFADCSGIALSHPMWAKARGNLSIWEFSARQEWVFDAIDPLENQYFASRRETLRALEMALLVWESTHGPHHWHALRG